MLVDSNLKYSLETILFSSNDEYVEIVIEICKNMCFHQPADPPVKKKYYRFGSYSEIDYAYSERMKSINNEYSQKVKTKLSRIIVPMIQKLLYSNDIEFNNRRCLLLQIYYTSSIEKCDYFLLMYGIDKLIMKIVDENNGISEGLINNLKDIPSQISNFKNLDANESIFKFKKDLSYENCIRTIIKDNIIYHICNIVKQNPRNECFILLNYILFVFMFIFII